MRMCRLRAVSTRHPAAAALSRSCASACAAGRPGTGRSAGPSAACNVAPPLGSRFRPRSMGYSLSVGQMEEVGQGLRHVRETLARWGLDGTWEQSTDAVLLAGELLANARGHGGGANTVEVSLRGTRLRISVSDASSFWPSPASTRWRPSRSKKSSRRSRSAAPLGDTLMRTERRSCSERSWTR